MALGSTQPLTEMSTRNFLESKGWPAHKADNLTTMCELIAWKMSEPRHFTTLWASTACYRDSFTFFTFYIDDNHVKWVPCHHGMVRPQVADGGDSPQIWRVAANILDKQLQIAYKGWSFSLGVGHGSKNFHCKK
jgi:hypothetical protein